MAGLSVHSNSAWSNRFLRKIANLAKPCGHNKWPGKAGQFS